MADRQCPKAGALAGRRRNPGILILIFAAALAAPASGPSPRRWEVTLTLRATGDYKLDEGEAVAIGRYSFSVRWRGWLERDDEDYLLYRLDCRLSDWQAQETASGQETTKILSTDDFETRPVFNLKYFMLREGLLHLDFAAERLTFPLSRPEDALPLLLPSSAQNGQREAAVDYNSCLIKGSNEVAVEEKDIYRGPVAKTFTWSFKREQWVLRQQRTVFAAQAHDVEVSLCIK